MARGVPKSDCVGLFLNTPGRKPTFAEHPQHAQGFRITSLYTLKAILKTIHISTCEIIRLRFNNHKLTELMSSG